MYPALSRKVADQADVLRGQFAEAQPFRHVTIDGFLDPDFCAQLIAEFPRFDSKKAISETGEGGGKAVVSNLAGLSAAYARFDALMCDREFLVAGRPYNGHSQSAVRSRVCRWRDTRQSGRSGTGYPRRFQLPSAHASAPASKSDRFPEPRMAGELGRLPGAAARPMGDGRERPKGRGSTRESLRDL